MAAGKPKVVDFRQGQDDLRGALRQGMLDAASRLLVEEGPAALTVRKVAEEVNCSTTLLYSIFGGKDGLTNALYLEGCSRLKRDFDAAAPELEAVDALQGVWVCARAYLGYARRNPSYYLVMFGDVIAGFIPPLESRVEAWGTFTPLIQQFERCMDEGLLPRSSPTAAARLLWAALHGIASLELKGYYLKKEHPDELFKAAVSAILLSLKNPQP
jgi:AcrR family transcriptional regulator